MIRVTITREADAATKLAAKVLWMQNMKVKSAVVIKMKLDLRAYKIRSQWFIHNGDIICESIGDSTLWSDIEPSWRSSHDPFQERGENRPAERKISIRLRPRMQIPMSWKCLTGMRARSWCKSLRLIVARQKQMRYLDCKLLSALKFTTPTWLCLTDRGIAYQVVSRVDLFHLVWSFAPHWNSRRISEQDLHKYSRVTTHDEASIALKNSEQVERVWGAEPMPKACRKKLLNICGMIIVNSHNTKTTRDRLT